MIVEEKKWNPATGGWVVQRCWYGGDRSAVSHLVQGVFYRQMFSTLITRALPMLTTLMRRGDSSPDAIPIPPTSPTGYHS